MDLLERKMTQTVKEAAMTVLLCYDQALLDPKVQLPTLLHAAMLALRKTLEAE